MKHLIFTCCILLLLLSGCAKSVHIIYGGTVDTPQKDTYEVTYQTNLEEGLLARITYVAGEGDKEKITNVTGSWSKTVILKSHQTLQLKVAAGGLLRKAEFKILVDGKVVSDYVKVTKNIIYNMRFTLP